MGEREGPWMFFHNNGQKMGAGNYQRGKAVGKWVYWNPDGSKAAEGMMKDGKFVGKWKHYDGQKIEIKDYSKQTKPAEKQQ